MVLSDFFRAHNKIALAFSGGADSSFLLYSAVKCSADVRPYFVKSEFQPQFELDDARKLCGMLGVRLETAGISVLDDENISANTEMRCYFCKRRILETVARNAARDGYAEIADGSNASDDAADRPGMRALSELSVLSPLRDCGLTKADIRRLSFEAGLFTWNKPAYSCLATRIRTGIPIDAECLKRIERTESELESYGLCDFRLRLTRGGIRLEVRENQTAFAQERLELIAGAVKREFGCAAANFELGVRKK